MRYWRSTWVIKRSEGDHYQAGGRLFQGLPAFQYAVGTSAYYVSININTQKKKIDAGLYIPNDKEVFHKLQQHKETFEQTIGKDIVFHDAGKSSRILLYHSINVKDRAKWSEAANWLFETALKFKRTVKEIDK